jgi:hypothetical protein
MVKSVNMKVIATLLPAFVALTLWAQSSKAETVVHNRNGTTIHNGRGTVVHTGGGTFVHFGGDSVVHTNYNYNHAYWRSHKYGYWNGQRGYWNYVNGRHVFVVVN